MFDVQGGTRRRAIAIARGKKTFQPRSQVLSPLPLRNAPIKVKPQGGGGGGKRADPGEFDILMAARVKFPTPRYLLNFNFPPLG